MTGDPRPAWKRLRWSALRDEQKREWLAHARSGDLARFTDAELLRYRDLAERRDLLRRDAQDMQRQIEELEADLRETEKLEAEAERELAEHQAAIEAAAARREAGHAPAGVPLPEPWSELWLDVSAATRHEGPRLCGGREGERCLTNGRAMFRVEEDVYQAALEAGFEVLPEGTSWSGIYGPAMELPHVRVALDSAVEVDHEPPYMAVGQACVSPAYVEILRKLGVEWVLVTGTPPEGHRGTASPVLSDLAIVIPMRIKDDSAEHGGGGR